MVTQITARRFQATPQLKDYIQHRLSKLDQFYDGITDARVILEKPKAVKEGNTVEITVNVYRKQLTAHDNAGSFEEAVDRCVRRLRRQVLKYKARLRNG